MSPIWPAYSEPPVSFINESTASEEVRQLRSARLRWDRRTKQWPLPVMGRGAMVWLADGGLFFCASRAGSGGFGFWFFLWGLFGADGGEKLGGFFQVNVRNPFVHAFLGHEGGSADFAAIIQGLQFGS